jgi:hypothetical protein
LIHPPDLVAKIRILWREAWVLPVPVLRVEGGIGMAGFTHDLMNQRQYLCLQPNSDCSALGQRGR